MPSDIALTPNPPFFPHFNAFRIDTDAATIHGVIGGSGPPVLLLQGWPQSHIEWRAVAPQLAKRYTVVATDLRGYGDSSKPPAGSDHAGYSKRSMAQDQVEVMRHLGFARFAVIGHDRGARVAHRMALDHAQVVTKLALLDIVPTLTVYSTVTKALATAYFHWFFLIQAEPIPETLIGSNARFFLEQFPFRGLVPQVIASDAFADYLRCFSNPATLHAMCEDYRAGATLDLEHDRADLARKVECPTFALWGEHGAMGRMYDVLATWRERCTNVYGKALRGGHWLPEECPREVTEALQDFLAAG
jgi:haloacetate dehalogenase